MVKHIAWRYDDITKLAHFDLILPTFELILHEQQTMYKLQNVLYILSRTILVTDLVMKDDENEAGDWPSYDRRREWGWWLT